MLGVVAQAQAQEAVEAVALALDLALAPDHPVLARPLAPPGDQATDHHTIAGEATTTQELLSLPVQVEPITMDTETCALVVVPSTVFAQLTNNATSLEQPVQSEQQSSSAASSASSAVSLASFALKEVLVKANTSVNTTAAITAATVATAADIHAEAENEAV